MVLADSSIVQAGPIGLVVIVALVVACVFLFRSMTRQLRRVPPSFEPPQEPEGPGDAAAPEPGRAEDHQI